MTYLSNIANQFNELTAYFDTIMPPKEAPIKEKVKEAIIQAYSNGYHDGQQAMADRLPKPTDTGGESGGEQYYNSL
jgi:hypothetical protein